MAQAQNEFLRSEQLFHALVENALVGIYIIQDERFVYINPTLEKIFGYPFDELRQCPVSDLVLPEDQEMVREKIRARVLGALDVAHYVVRARAKDGRLIWLEVLEQRFEWNGRPAILGTVLDITSAKQTENLRNILLAIGTQILHDASTAAILKKVTQALAQHSKFRKIGVSIYAAPAALGSPAAPRISEHLTAGLTAEEEQHIRQKIATGQIISDQRILETGQPIGTALYVTTAIMPELPEYNVALGTAGPTWGPHDILYVFLRIGDTIWGRIALADPVDGQVPTAAEFEPLALLANLATLAIQQARHSQKQHEQQQQMQSLILFLQALNQPSSLTELLDIIIREALLLIPKANAGTFLLLNPMTNCFEFKSAIGHDLKILQQVTFPYEHSAQQLGLEQGPQIFTRTRQMQLAITEEIVSITGLPAPASTISLPLRDESGKIIAILNINNLEEEGVLGPEDLERLAALHTQLKLALARERDRAHLRALTKLDALTEVYNRRALEEELQRLEKMKRPFALVFADIDDFHEINDRFGHLEGDQVIRELAGFLSRSVRASDGVYRYGGDEFTILMEGANRAEAERVLTRLEQKLQELRARWRERLQELEIVISLGVSDWSPDAPRMLKEVLEEADQFMYRRKRAKKA